MDNDEQVLRIWHNNELVLLRSQAQQLDFILTLRITPDFDNFGTRDGYLCIKALYQSPCHVDEIPHHRSHLFNAFHILRITYDVLRGTRNSIDSRRVSCRNRRTRERDATSLCQDDTAGPIEDDCSQNTRLLRKSS
jgi:hypothetical protein